MRGGSHGNGVYRNWYNRIKIFGIVERNTFLNQCVCKVFFRILPWRMNGDQSVAIIFIDVETIGVGDNSICVYGGWFFVFRVFRLITKRKENHGKKKEIVFYARHEICFTCDLQRYYKV